MVKHKMNYEEEIKLLKLQIETLQFALKQIGKDFEDFKRSVSSGSKASAEKSRLSRFV